ncbi:MAG: helix-turn-helix domain-containing protein [Candidatus Bathyarchaeota archaeon]
MSQEKVLQTLSNLGLTRLDIRVYIYLAKKGSQKAIEISKALKIQKQQLYRSLKKLQNKAIVSATLERPARFSAVPFEKVLDLFIKAKLKEAQNIQTEKNKLLSSWQSIQSGETSDVSARFMVIEGRNVIYSRIKQMINETKNQLSLISTVTGLVRADRFGLLDIDFKRPKLSNVQFRLLTYITNYNANLMKAILKEIPKTQLRFEIKNPNLGLGLFPQMVIRDEEEVMFFINPKVDGTLPEEDNLCLWTNCKSMIHSFLVMFEDLWRNSTDIEKKITDVKTENITPKTFLISDSEIIEKKYNEIINSSQQEILILTSSKDLVELSREFSQIKRFTDDSITIKIMAPIVRENWKAMQQLSNVCHVRHVPQNYWKTIIVDDIHLLQFGTTSSNYEQFGLTRADSAFYSADPEWIKTMRTALLDIWTNAQPPSSKTLESVIGRYGSPLFPMPNNDLRSKLFFKVIDLKPHGTIKEKDLLNKIIHAKKIIPKDLFKDISAGYGSYAVGNIHLPKRFNLPDILIQAYRFDKQSSLGAGESILVYQWLKTPEGFAYVPVAIADDNPKGFHTWLLMMKGTPAEKNILSLQKDQIQVQVHGNTLFAGWTVPIPLFPEKFILPPACMLVEGYGKSRTSGFTILFPNGTKCENEGTSFDAFVTFIHPATNYSGPSTDGILVRDYLTKIIPA